MRGVVGRYRSFVRPTQYQLKYVCSLSCNNNNNNNRIVPVVEIERIFIKAFLEKADNDPQQSLMC